MDPDLSETYRLIVLTSDYNDRLARVIDHIVIVSSSRCLEVVAVGQN